MIPGDYCAEKAARSGSDWHYSRLFAPVEQRPRITALIALREEMRQIVHDSSEHALAHARLGWWREEIGTTLPTSPQHPILQALAAGRAENTALRDVLLRLVQAVEIELAGGPLQTPAEVQRFGEYSEGSLALLCLPDSAMRDETARQAALVLGEALTMVELLGRARQDARLGRVLLAISDLHRYKVTAADLAQAEWTEPVRELAADYIARARRCLTAFDAAAGPRQPANYIQARLLEQRLARMPRQVFRQSDRPSRRYFLYKLFTAWRAARRTVRQET